MKTHLTIYRDRVSVVTNAPTAQFLQNSGGGSGPRWHKGYSVRQRTHIKRAANAIVETGPTEFVTLTFPNLPEYRTQHERYDNVIEDGEAFRLLRKFLRKVRRFSTKPDAYMWVAEVQPKRLARRHERAVHFHLLLPKLNSYVADAQVFYTCVWWSLIGSPMDENDRPIMPQVRVEECVSTPGAYLAKYLGKDDERLPEDLWIKGNGYGISHAISAALKPLNCAHIEGSHVPEISEYVEGALRSHLGDCFRDVKVYNPDEWVVTFENVKFESMPLFFWNFCGEWLNLGNDLRIDENCTSNQYERGGCYPWVGPLHAR